jgi:hypothetical protein
LSDENIPKDNVDVKPVLLNVICDLEIVKPAGSRLYRHWLKAAAWIGCGLAGCGRRARGATPEPRESRGAAP